ncbi:MAG: Crp/Fnr family transcriptional regulator [Sphingobium sp.]
MKQIALTGNKLISALRPQDRLVLAEMVDEVHLTAGTVIYHPGDEVRYAYFPRFSAIASFHVVMSDGSAVETAITGCEGAVCGIVSKGSLPAYARCCIMHGGDFYRISCANLNEAAERSPYLRNLFARYADCLVSQIFQSVACNATHTIEQRAAKWLAAAVDRTGSKSVTMTQDQLGSILGVGRTYVSRVIRRMKEAGTVETRRGAIVVKQRDHLDRISCDCNQLVEQHFETVLRGVYPHANGQDGWTASMNGNGQDARYQIS